MSAMGANGGMSFSNSFIVRLINPPSVITSGYTNYSDTIELFCDEAQLPNISTDAGNIKGLHTGLGIVDYPHTKVFTDVQLGFMCDADMTALKLLTDWYDSMWYEMNENSEARRTYPKYRHQYACDLQIIKTERGPTGDTQRQSIKYTLHKAWPFSIDSVPLQFGQAQVTKVTAQFKYQRHTVEKLSVRNVKDMEGVVVPGSTIVGRVDVGGGIIEEQYLTPFGQLRTRRVPGGMLPQDTPTKPVPPAKKPERERLERRPGESPREFAQRRARR
tara:strand:- start:846 stop:1667 length:822 start_codon:yes stop_codon:yes gene_type:complete